MYSIVYFSRAMTCCFWCWKWNMWAEWASFLSPVCAAPFGDLVSDQPPTVPGVDDVGDDLSDDLPLWHGPGPVTPYAGYSTSWAAFARLCHLPLRIASHFPEQWVEW